MRDLTSFRPGSLCYDPSLAAGQRLRIARAGDPDGEIVMGDGLIACPRWIQPTYDALAECAEHGRDVVCVRGNRVSALVRAQIRPDRPSRRQQFRRHDHPSAALDLARSLVTAKSAGQLTVLRRAARQRRDSDLDTRASRLARDRHGIDGSPSINILRGREGIIARTYFGGWPRLLGLPDFQRVPRRALNPINLLLDLCYSRVCLAVTLALLDQGLDLALGTLHAHDDRRPTLALDLMEPLRPLIADRFVLGCHAEAISGEWFGRQGTRWNLTTQGRQRWRQRWDTWFHGGSRRAGQVGAVARTVAVYQQWVQGDHRLSWPAIDG